VLGSVLGLQLRLWLNAVFDLYGGRGLHEDVLLGLLLEEYDVLRLRLGLFLVDNTGPLLLLLDSGLLLLLLLLLLLRYESLLVAVAAMAPDIEVIVILAILDVVGSAHFC